MDEEGREQFYCINGNDGYHWKVHSMPTFDKLPSDIREQLAQSPFNICPLCFDQKVSQIKSLHPDWPRKKLLSAAIKIREHEIRKLGRVPKVGRDLKGPSITRGIIE